MEREEQFTKEVERIRELRTTCEGRMKTGGWYYGDWWKNGARWADEHPNGVSMSYLQSWYQDSIDETKEPIWTDKHLEELFNDFYLIAKKKEE